MEKRLMKPLGFEFEFSPANSETAFAEELFLNGQIRSLYHQQVNSMSSHGGKIWFPGPLQIAPGEKNPLPLTAPAKEVFVRYDEREIMAKPVNWSATQSRRSTQKLLANRRKSFLPYKPCLLGCGSLSGVVVDCHDLPVLKLKRDP